VATNKKIEKLVRMLTDGSVPMEMRRQLLQQLFESDEDAAQEAVASVLESAAQATAGEALQAKAAELSELLDQMRRGPLRCATFDKLIESTALGDGFGQSVGRRAQVILPDGTSSVCVVASENLCGALRCGDTVWLDAQGGVLLFHVAGPTTRGEEARLERHLENGDVEVNIGDHSRFVCRTASHLRDQIDRGEADPGCTVIVCQRKMIAFWALPSETGASHLRFIAREPVPDVIVERDVGSPPAFIEQLAEAVRRELVAPEIARRYGLRRSRMLLLTGVPGTGKTLSIHALWRRIYEVIAEHTGVAIEALPQRVMRLRSSQVLSKWVGSSDKNIARFFDEIAELAAERFQAPDGSLHELPVLVICEEIDALARQRGEDAIHDRIQTTLLEGLDPARPLYRDRQVIVVCSTNTPNLVDPAFVRRAGGTVTRFGRMDRFTFRAVLEKLLGLRPFAHGDGQRRRTSADLTAWLFAKNAQGVGQVQLTFVGQAHPVVKHRRDFLTAALLDRAVQAASLQACNDEFLGVYEPGLTTEGLMSAIDEQVRDIVEMLTPANCEQYLTLPDGMRVGTLQRIEQPRVLPIALERAS